MQNKRMKQIQFTKLFMEKINPNRIKVNVVGSFDCSPFISYENFNARVKGCLYHIDVLKLSEENNFGQSFLKLILKSQI